MSVKRRGIRSNILLKATALLCTALAVICFSVRISDVIKSNDEKLELFAAELTLPDSNKNELKKDSKTHQKHSDRAINPFNPTATPAKTQEDDGSNGDENKYNIIESQFGEGGMNYENFYVKNNTDYDLNIAEELDKKPDITLKKDGSPQVLIVHTHTSESYMQKDLGFYYESFCPRSTDNNKNVTRVGNAIAEKLKANGIETIHDSTYHDNPSYNGSYARSADTINSILEKYPSIGVVLDIHRDSIGNNEKGKVKPTFWVNGTKASQIMIIAGCDLDGSLEFPDWEYNLRFALRLQKMAETMYPGMTRPMSFGEYRYNMNITHGSLLIEIGTDANTIDESVRSGELLGNVLTKVLEELKE